MKFKLDENVPRRAKQLLIDEGHEVTTVQEESLVGEPDTVIAKAANQEGRILVTLDKDLGDLRSFPPGTHPGIVVLRVSDQSPPHVTQVLANLLREFDLNNLVGCLTVLEDTRVRIRRP